MRKPDLTFEEAFEIRDRLKRLESNHHGYPLSFTYPVMRILNILDRAHKNYTKARRKTAAAMELEKFNAEQMALYDEILEKDHVGNFVVEGEGAERRNVPKDPETYKRELAAFWDKWKNHRALQFEQAREDREYLERDFDEEIRTIKFGVIPSNIEPEIVMALLPFIEDAPDELPSSATSRNTILESEDREAA